MTGGAGTVDELVGAARAILQVLRRRLPEIVTGVAAMATLLGALAVAGAAVDDAAIDDNRAVASAEVLEGSTFARTLVRFTTANGQTVIPEYGVAYPRGLEPGATVAVEYDLTGPGLARVAGRGAFDQLGSVLLGLLGVWAVAAPLALWLRRPRRQERG